jgi:hypothetical protein
MWYSYGLRAVVARLVHKMLVRAVDSVAPADPLSADYQVPDKPLDNGPEFDARTVSADLDLGKLRIWVDACDACWDRGFRDSQKEVSQPRGPGRREELRKVTAGPGGTDPASDG